jgi:hypothetical protein
MSELLILALVVGGAVLLSKNSEPVTELTNSSKQCGNEWINLPNSFACVYAPIYLEDGSVFSVTVPNYALPLVWDYQYFSLPFGSTTHISLLSDTAIGNNRVFKFRLNGTNFVALGVYCGNAPNILTGEGITEVHVFSINGNYSDEINNEGMYLS